MKNVFLNAGIVWALCVCSCWAAQTNDPLILSAQRALLQGQPIAAYQLMQEHADADKPGQACFIRARALLAMGRAQEARSSLAVTDRAALARWPQQWHGAVAAIIGEAEATLGKTELAQQWLSLALKKPGSDVVVDRVLLLYAETLLKMGDKTQAERIAHAIWRDWPRSSYRARAGLLEARLIAERLPDQARGILAGVRTLDDLDAPTHTAAAELLCRLLLERQPAQCLEVAEQAIAALGAVGALPMYRALAMVELDPQSGLESLRTLPPSIQQTPAVQAAINRVQQNEATTRHEQTPHLIARARTEIALGHPQAARQLMLPIAKTEPLALQVLATISGQSLEEFISAPAMQDPLTAQMVGIALAQQGALKKAWPLLQSALQNRREQQQTAGQLTSLYYWAVVSAEQMAPEHVPVLRKQMLGLSGQGLEIGLAWSAEAQRLEQQQAAPEAIRAAWDRAAVALPISHPWHPAAAWRAAKPLMDSPHINDLKHAQGLLLPATAVGDSVDHRRCRFYLVQLFERMGRPQEAMQIVESLRFGANSEQTERLDRLTLRLQLAISSNNQSDPLDAAN